MISDEQIILSHGLYHEKTRKQIFETLTDSDFLSSESFACFSGLRIAYESDHEFTKDYINTVAGNYPNVISFEAIAHDLNEAMKNLKTRSIKKRVTDEMTFAQTVVSDPITPLNAVKDVCSKMMDIAASADNFYNPLPKMQDTIKSAINRMDRIRKGEEKFYTLELEGLEEVKLAPGDLCVIAGRPAQGKTAISLDIARRSAQKGIKCAFICLETDSDILTWRLLSQQSDVEYRKIQDGGGDLTAGESASLMQAVDVVSKLPINVISRYKQSIQNITSMCKDLKAQGYEMIFIDYLQKVEESKASRNRFDAVAKICSDLKNIALSQELVIVPLAQLNRDSDNGMPRMGNLAESAKIEQDASAIILIDRPDALKPMPARQYMKGEQKISEKDLKNRLAMIIAKNRNGATGIRFYDHDMSRFKILRESVFGQPR